MRHREYLQLLTKDFLYQKYFIECNGKKIAVEVFGEYWHSPLLNPKVPYSRTLKGKRAIFKKYGWELIVFWESELKSKDAEKIILDRLTNYR